MPLTDTTVRNAKPDTRPRKLSDGGGMFLLVMPTGAKWWRLAYRYGGKQKLLSLGIYPETSLKDARDQRDAAKRLLAQGVDPSAHRKAEKASRYGTGNTFELVAREWFERHLSAKATSHSYKVIRRLERYVFPDLGRQQVDAIKAPDILAVIRKIEDIGKIETAHRAMQHIGQVIRYAIATGRAESDPTLSLRGALPPSETHHMAAPTDAAKVGELLRMMDAFDGGAIVKAAIELLPLIFVRPGELRTMRWEEIDFEAKEWRYTTGKKSTRNKPVEHLVPLSRQALAILETLRPMTAHLRGGWVFIGGRSSGRPMSAGAIGAAYKRLGIDTRNELTPHGWRAAARTLLHEHLRYPPEVIEHQLAHAVPDALGRAYNRTRFLDDRRKMMQAWADYLDTLKHGAQVIPIRPMGTVS
jgi:integrase